MFVGVDDAVSYGFLGGSIRRGTTNVVYADVDLDVIDARVSEDVAFETGESVGAEAVGENTVTAGGLVGNGDVGAFVFD